MRRGQSRAEQRGGKGSSAIGHYSMYEGELRAVELSEQQCCSRESLAVQRSQTHSNGMHERQ